MEECCMNCTLFQKKVIILFNILSSFMMLVFAVYQLLIIKKENIEDNDKTDIHLLNLTTIVSFIFWCFAFGLNKELMTRDIHN